MAGSSEIEMLIQSLVGGGEPNAGAITPRLTAAVKDLPGQQYKKMKKAKGGAKELPNMEPGMKGDMSGSDFQDASMDNLIDMVMSGLGNEMAPMGAGEYAAGDNGGVIMELMKQFGIDPATDTEVKGADDLGSILGLINENPLTPKLGMTKKGEIPANTNLMSGILKKLKDLTAEDEADLSEPDGDADDED